jgi:hypothetical protein
LFTHPALGAVAVADVAEEREPAGEWTVKGVAWLASLPDPGRQLAGRILVGSPDINLTTGSFGQGSKTPIPLGWSDLWFTVQATPGSGDSGPKEER